MSAKDERAWGGGQQPREGPRELRLVRFVEEMEE